MNGLLHDSIVALVRERAAYPEQPPFHPSESFPEWPGASVGVEDNAAYRGVRSALHALSLDAANFGSEAWNPLRGIAMPGESVLLKPNFVSHRNLLDPVRGDTDCLITHGSVIRAALDYTAKAMDGRGTITIADCPIQSTDWEALLLLVGLPQVVADARSRFPNIAIHIVDCRMAVAVVRKGGAVDRYVRMTGGASEVELGSHSLLVPITRDGVDFGVTHYGRERMRAAHTATRHAYLMGNRFLDCDVLINLPKLKSHQKAGVTCALKNLVGVNAHKDYLPHFRFGSVDHGGDEYPTGNWFWEFIWWMRHREWEHDSSYRKQLWALAAGVAKQCLPYLAGIPRESTSLGGGGWFGNDTLWRTVLDINRAFFYYDPQRKVVGDTMVARRYFAIVDGLVGGDRESPLFPSRVESGIMMAGMNPVAIDVVASAVMGFDWERIPQLRNAFLLESLPLTTFQPADIQIRGTRDVSSIDDVSLVGFVPFTPSLGFRGHIERASEDGRISPAQPVQASGADDSESSAHA